MLLSFFAHSPTLPMSELRNTVSCLLNGLELLRLYSAMVSEGQGRTVYHYSRFHVHD